METQTKTANRVIKVELLQEVVNYLSKQPFGEVHQLVNSLLQLPEEHPTDVAKAAECV